MLKFGYITQWAADKQLARVEFKDMGTDENPFVTPWLQVIVLNSLKNKDSITFDVGEQVACMMDAKCHIGVVLGSIYSKTDLPTITDADTRGVVFDDGVEVSYNRATSELTIKGPKKVTVVCEKATIEATNGVDITGDLKVTGKIDSTDKITAAGDIDSGGTVTAVTDVKANTTSLKTHIHQVPAAPGPSSPPTL